MTTRVENYRERATLIQYCLEEKLGNGNFSRAPGIDGNSSAGDGCQPADGGSTFQINASQSGGEKLRLIEWSEL